MKRRTIGVLSRESGVKVTTIRYYESVGLAPEPERSARGQRVYDEAAVQRLNFIRHARDLGFPLDDIRKMISLQDSPGTDCAQVGRIARGQLLDVRRRIQQLQALEAELDQMISVCDGGVTADCNILHTLSDSDCANGAHDAGQEFGRIG